MLARAQARRTTSSNFSTDKQRWRALVRRDEAADGAFVYSVKTTGVYCRPNCRSRLPRRENVRFHATCAEAQAAGFRPCKRCRPTQTSPAERRAAAIANACRLIEQSDELPTLAELAAAAGMSSYHFHRLFKAQTGVTPKAYAQGRRAERLRSELTRRKTVTEAMVRAGFDSSGRFYETAREALGMSPKAYQTGGAGTTIRFAIGQCWLGAILVAATEKGVCAILLGDDAEELAHDLERRFPRAQLLGGDAAFERFVAQVVGFVADPARGWDLPLDVRGTAFQQRVWQALREIPAGTTASYAEIARRVGRPHSFRAVGQAIAANPIAVAIPCHRVVRTDGSLSGYRWGVDRKSKLQQRERK